MKRIPFSSNFINKYSRLCTPFLFFFLIMLIAGGESYGSNGINTTGFELPFITNEGQMDSQIRFFACTFGGALFVTQNGDIVYSFIKENGQEMLALKEELVGSAIDRIVGEQEIGTSIGYFKGDDPSLWKSGLTGYETVSLGNVYPGVLLKLRAYCNNIEKIFTVQPGSNAEAIRLRLNGAKELLVNHDGELEVSTALGKVSFSRPMAYQEIDGKRVYVDAAYVKEGDIYSFKIGDYDQSRDLIIDPLLASTFIGGSNDDSFSMALDMYGNIYLAGRTNSTDLPIITGGYGSVYAGGAGDAYIAKFNADLTDLTAATFFGGSGLEDSIVIALDTAGNVFIAGKTESNDIPVTENSYNDTLKGQSNLFIARFDSNLTTLAASTYLGGSLNDAWCCGVHIEIDHNNNVFISALTNSNDFPTTTGAYDTTYNDYDTDDVVISKLDQNLSSLLASTYLGGSLWDVVYGMELDASGNVYVVGRTSSSNFPITSGAYSANYQDPHPYYDGFVSKLSNDLSSLVASTYIGTTSKEDIIWAVAPAPDGNVYISGSTISSAFPVTEGAYDTAFGGTESDGFICKLNSSFSTLLASTFLGGSGYDRSTGISMDIEGNIHIFGYTNSTDFPVTEDAYDLILNNGGEGTDGFYAKMDGDLTTLQYATFIGGSSGDSISSLKITPSGRLYLSGTTSSTDFPVTAGSYDMTYNGNADSYLMLFAESECDYSDQDSDGVIDKWDICPDTTQGSYVDKNGCQHSIIFDINGDGKTGLDEAIHILRQISGQEKP